MLLPDGRILIHHLTPELAALVQRWESASEEKLRTEDRPPRIDDPNNRAAK